MTATLHHRGPDDRGVWCDGRTGIALGHARLSVVDTTQSGHQPMVSANGRWVISYNGEIYNASVLRMELESQGVLFRGHSDTEVILEAVAVWGIDKTIQRLLGMFAIALWDRCENTLLLVRDRLGIKPLYWGRFNGLLVFGSELKSLRAHPGWKPEINRDALAGYMRHNYVPAPLSIYKGVYKLEPGCMLTLRPDAKLELSRYWDLRQIAVAEMQNAAGSNESEAIEELDTLLRDTVCRHMMADVPLGALLSGGIDSSLVVALMQAQSELPVKTFSIGFREQSYNEAVQASSVARHLRTDHTELYLDPEHALAALPHLPEWYDEPFADSSQVPIFLVSELTRQHVTVALSGDGGDELFGGYTRYFWARVLWEKIGVLPAPMRRTAARAIRMLSPTSWDRLAAAVPTRWKPAHPGDKAHKLAAILGESSPDAIYRWLVSQWQQPEDIVLGSKEPVTPIWDDSLQDDFPDFTDRMQYMDTVTYLPDDILTKVDRASMAVSLEVRVPLLDHRVVEFAWRQPRERKIRGGQGKWLLRQVLDQYVPRSLVERPKMGFGVPIDEWLRGPLRDWAEELLDERKIREAGLLNPVPIRQKWQAHLRGHQNWQYPLWGILMFQAWHERWA